MSLSIAAVVAADIGECEHTAGSELCFAHGSRFRGEARCNEFNETVETAKKCVDAVLRDLWEQVNVMRDHHVQQFEEFRNVNNLRALMHSDYRDCFATVLDLIDEEMTT